MSTITVKTSSSITSYAHKLGYGSARRAIESIIGPNFNFEDIPEEQALHVLSILIEKHGARILSKLTSPTTIKTFGLDEAKVKTPRTKSEKGKRRQREIINVDEW